MNALKKCTVAILVLLSGISSAQIKNTTTQSVKIFGNCGMCEAKIEKAGNLKNIAQVDWNADSKMASLTYDESKTNPDEILKRIALVGYDNEKFLAPDEAYAKLPGCCQYDREAKVPVKAATLSRESNLDKNEPTIKSDNQDPSSSELAKQSNPLKPVFDQYFLLKDALVKTDGKTASTAAAALLTAIVNVEMVQLTSEVHVIWMKVLPSLKANAEDVAKTKDVKIQRQHFIELSKIMYELIKASKLETPTYYQFCPMANDGKGANWLSKENDIKNPYYGSQMLSCGKTMETIK